MIGGFGIGAPAATSVVESLRAIGVREFVEHGHRRRAAGRSRHRRRRSCATAPCATRACRTTTCRRRCGPSPRPALTARLHDAPRRRRAVAGGRARPGRSTRRSARRVTEAEHYADAGRGGGRDGGRRAVHRRPRCAASRWRPRSPSATRWPTASGCRTSPTPGSPPACCAWCPRPWTPCAAPAEPDERGQPGAVSATRRRGGGRPGPRSSGGCATGWRSSSSGRSAG